MKLHANCRSLVLAAAVGVTTMGATSIAPAAASAKTSVCKVGVYYPDIETQFPAPGRLRAHNLPRWTDGYAPRCMVAEWLVANVQWYWADHGHAPRRVDAMNDVWDGGVWHLKYRLRSNGDVMWAEFTATQGTKRVTWEGYS
jgi:hypothetical protein